MPRRKKKSPKKCALNRARTQSGGCSGIVPCMGPRGGSLPYAKRGRDGHCRLKRCQVGKIRNYETGRCNSRKSRIGSKVALAHRYDNAVRFARAYEGAHARMGQQPQTYYDQFNAGALETGANPKRLEHGRQIRQRRIEAERKRYNDWMNDRNNRPPSLIDHLKRAVKGVTGGIFA